MAAMQLTRMHKVLIGVVVAGAVLIAAIGFAGSYSAVRELALEKGFGDFSSVFPIGIDAGICVLLALDLLLTWMRIPFPMLRQTAWLLTIATIAFNGAAAWPDPLGTGMHAVIPVLFVVAVEAARHAVGRIADITADKHMEGVRLTRWLLSPIPTFKLWRRMKLWELRSYEQVIKLEQERLIYQARLQARFGRNWRRKAPVESMMPLRLAKYGVPLAETAPAGLAAAGIEPALLPPGPGPAGVQAEAQHPQLPYVPQQGAQPGPEEHRQQAPQHRQAELPQEGPGSHDSPWFAAPQVPDDAYERAYNPTYVEGLEPTPVRVPSGPGGRTRPLGNVGTIGAFPHPRSPEEQYEQPYEQQAPQHPERQAGPPYPEQPQDQQAQQLAQQHSRQEHEQDRPQDDVQPPLDAQKEAEWAAAEADFSEKAYEVFCAYTQEHQDYPTVAVLDIHLADGHNVRHPRSSALLRRLLPGFKQRFDSEMSADHIA